MVCDPADGSHCAQALLEGCPAAFGGQLLTEGLAVHLGQEAASKDVEVLIAVTATAAWWRVQRDFALREGAINTIEAGKRNRIEGYRKGFEEGVETASPGLLEHPLVIVAVTVAACVGLFIATERLRDL